jgi:hypothetical protein
MTFKRPWLVCLLLVAAAIVHTSVLAKPSTNDEPQSWGATSYPEALARAKPVPLVRGKKLRSATQSSDPTIAIAGDAVHFKIFALPEGPRARLSIRSLCSCFGFRKRVMPPIARLLDEHGELVGRDFTFTPGHPGVQFVGVMPAEAIPDAARYVIVFGDPKIYLSGRKTSADAYFVAPLPMTLPLPVGYKEMGTLHVTYGGR